MSDLRTAAGAALALIKKLDGWIERRHGIGLMPEERKVADDLYAALAQELAQPKELRGVADALESGDGMWRSCSGCYETNEGYPPNGAYFSKPMACYLGCGCSECGGLGAIWDTTDYDEMADAMERSMGQTVVAQEPAQPAPQPAMQEPRGRQIGTIRFDARQQPYASLTTCYDENGNAWAPETPIYAAPQPAQPAVQEPDCWAILTPNGSKLVSPNEAKGRKDAYPLYTYPAAQPDQIIEISEALQIRRILEEIKKVAAIHPAADMPIPFQSAWQQCCEEIFFRATGEQWHMDEDAARFASTIQNDTPKEKAMNEPIKTGGPAFPRLGPYCDDDFIGLTKRDYFAAKAMQSLLAKNGVCYPLDAWEMADAMLATREAK